MLKWTLKCMTSCQRIDLEKIKLFSRTFFSIKDVPGPIRLYIVEVHLQYGNKMAVLHFFHLNSSLYLSILFALALAGLKFIPWIYLHPLTSLGNWTHKRCELFLKKDLTSVQQLSSYKKNKNIHFSIYYKAYQLTSFL